MALAGAKPGAAKSQGDKLWEDNWDDDDVEEDFSEQLRCACEHRVFSRVSLENKEGTGKDSLIQWCRTYGTLAVSIVSESISN